MMSPLNRALTAEEARRFARLDQLFSQVALLDDFATVEAFRPDLLATDAWQRLSEVLDTRMLHLLADSSERLWMGLLTEDTYLRRALAQQAAAVLFAEHLDSETRSQLTLAWSFCAVTLDTSDIDAYSEL